MKSTNMEELIQAFHCITDDSDEKTSIFLLPAAANHANLRNCLDFKPIHSSFYYTIRVGKNIDNVLAEQLLLLSKWENSNNQILISPV